MEHIEQVKRISLTYTLRLISQLEQTIVQSDTSHALAQE